jgi:hypothetical protein
MRSNSGIIGKSVTVNPYNASGIFGLNEVSNLSTDKQWALGYNLTKIFPQAYLDLIRSCKNVFYVTESDGFDGIKNAIYKCSGGLDETTSNNAIVILPGNYNCANGINIHTGLAVNNETPLLADYGCPINFICAPGQVTLSYVQDITGTGARDCTTVRFEHAYSKLVGAYIKRDNGGAVDNFSVAWFYRHHGGLVATSNVTSFFAIAGNVNANYMLGNISNCVLREVNANNLWSRTYAPNGTAKFKIQNSVLYAGAAGMADFQNNTGITWDYIACNTTKGTGTTPWTNSVESVSFNPDFSYTGNAAGVYSGTFAWDASLTTVSTTS